MTGIIGGVSVSKFSQIQCPVPPLAEQSRIIAKIDELLDICEKLKENISKKQTFKIDSLIVLWNKTSDNYIFIWY